MELTTRLALYSQTTRLLVAPYVGKLTRQDGTFTLCGALFQGNLYLGLTADDASKNYNSALRPDFNLSSSLSLAATKGILVGFFSSA